MGFINASFLIQQGMLGKMSSIKMVSAGTRKRPPPYSAGRLSQQRSSFSTILEQKGVFHTHISSLNKQIHFLCFFLSLPLPRQFALKAEKAARKVSTEQLQHIPQETASWKIRCVCVWVCLAGKKKTTLKIHLQTVENELRLFRRRVASGNPLAAISGDACNVCSVFFISPFSLGKFSSEEGEIN